MVNKHFTMSV